MCAALAACGGPQPVAAPGQTAVQTVQVSEPESEVVELALDEEYAALAELLQRPAAEQVNEWRNWAQSHPSARLRAHALAHLTWVEDASALELATEAISSPAVEVQAQAARVLSHLGLPRATSARALLLAAVKGASEGSLAQLVWALVVLEEPRVFGRAMQLYQRGELEDVTRLDGGSSFDLRQLARLNPTLAEKHTGATSPEMRRLTAASLASKAEPSHTGTLAWLAADRDLGVASEAVRGLARIGTTDSRQALVEVLKAARIERFNQLVSALRDDVGTRGLIMALDGLSSETSGGWQRARTVFDAIEGRTSGGLLGLNDPRSGEALQAFIAGRPHVHWQTRAASALARIGDVRGVPTLAARLRMDPLKVYRDWVEWEQLLMRSDDERVTAARLIADLAVMHPNQRDTIRAQAEDAVEFWLLEMPWPHANGMRALAAMRSTQHVGLIRSWANPKVPLPQPGQQPPMPQEWITAQSAMRYAGQLQDTKSWPVLLNALKARPKDIDLTMNSLMQGGLAILGMSLRAIGVGAAHGLSEWGDPRAFGPLLAYVEGARENEQSRMEACAALGWVATRDDRTTLIRKVREYDQPEQSSQFVRSCLLEAFVARPEPALASELVALLTVDEPAPTRHQIARALGRGGVDGPAKAKLVAALQDEVLTIDAAVALLLGTDAATAVRIAAWLALNAPSRLEEASSVYHDSLGYWSHADLEEGRVFRWVENALAISRAPLPDKVRQFARTELERQFDNLRYDNGPHSLTRPVFRHRLLVMARSQEPATRRGALQTLLLAGEQGVLLALREEVAQERSEWANEVRRAYREVTHPATPRVRFQDPHSGRWGQG